ncbi:bacteriophage N4 adsorption protein A [Paraburkholderia phenazinium]|uniref:Tetratricopeptide repeat-containing protein n=1 Tax=Paraburkholderia phenazinium TaxID=60549 RepID=A0A1G8FXK9_9BURK|nr:bacteriophage N4 adsorption protein A [Paraburkholderia phenazinium]SDH86871.1 Tetratricopeptide repeat-containing protein [Paraburkholderia phenazinium]
MIYRPPPCTQRRAACALSLTLALASGSAVADENLPLPLTGSAYRIADQAYSEYARGDYEAAARDAREAVRLRPDVPRLRSLLQQAEAALRNRGKAASAAPVASAAPTDMQRASELASQALDLLAHNDVASASRDIGQAVDLAPDVSQYRLLQVSLLIRLQNYDAAETASRAALAAASDDSMVYVMHGYLLQRGGHYDSAHQYYEQALSGDSLGDADLRSVRLLVADLALSAGDTKSALDALQSLPDNDADAQERRLFAQTIATGSKTLRPELKPPVLLCIVNRFGPVCSVFASDRPSQALANEAFRAAAENRQQEALDLFQLALQIGGANRELEGRRDAVRRQLAQQPASVAYQAMADNDPDLAQKEIAQAISYAPDVMPYRLLQIDALGRKQQYAAAEAAASEAMHVDDEDAVPVLLRGYLRQMQGKYAAARVDYGKALQNDTLSDDDLRNVRLYVADAAMAAGDTKLSGDTLHALPSGDEQAAWRRSLMAFYEHHSGHPTLQAPFLDCRETPYGTACTARPADNAPNVMIEAIYKALGRKENATALALARDLTASSPKNDQYRRVLAQALRANGQIQEAQRVMASLKDPVPDLGFAYLASMSGAPALALQTFQQMDDAGELPPRALQDAGFAAINANQRPTAVNYFKRSIDAASDDELDLPPQSLYETRRAVSELERQWGAYVSLNYRGSNNMQAGQNESAVVGDNLQIGTEAYWRPPALDKDGTYVDLYARLTDTAYSAPTASTNDLTGDTFVGKSPTGFPSLLSALGIRWKPLASQNVIAAFERQQAIGSAAQSDWLARLGYSYGTGTDLRADVPSWNTDQVYAETGYYMVAKTYYFTSELQSGRSFLLPASWLGHTVLWPHVVVGADYNDVYSKPWAVGAGAGVNLRTWLREDHYHAPRSYFDLSVQYRLKVAGDERAKGWFIRSVFNY